MDIHYDPKANALYARFNSGKVTHATIVSELVNVDFDADNNIVGIELLDVASQVEKANEVRYNVLQSLDESRAG